MSSESLRNFFVDANKKVIFALCQPFVHEHHGKLIVRDGCIAFALKFRNHLLCGEFGGLPLAKLKSVFDHLFLTG